MAWRGEEQIKQTNDTSRIAPRNEHKEQAAMEQQIEKSWCVWFSQGCWSCVVWFVGSCLINYPQRYCYTECLFNQGVPARGKYPLLCGTVVGSCLCKSGRAFLGPVRVPRLPTHGLMHGLESVFALWALRLLCTERYKVYRWAFVVLELLKSVSSRQNCP